MKPDVVKFLFDCYLKEKKQESTKYDVVDGVAWTPRKLEQGTLSGEASGVQEDSCNDVSYIIAESSSPYEVYHEVSYPIAQGYEAYYAPLLPREEELARQFGRQLSNMSDEFDELRTSERRYSASSATGVFQFQKRCLFVSPSSGKVVIPITRVGNADEESTVEWKTKNKTACAGIHYFEGSGKLLFKKGEIEKSIEILLLGNYQNRDLSFQVELLDSDSIEIGDVNPLTVNIIDHDHLYPDEKNVVENIVESRRFSLPNVASCLTAKVTVNTFKTALLYMCSNADSVPQEFAYAFELLRVALPSARRDTLLGVVCDYFKSAPELEKLQEYIEELSGSEKGSGEENNSD